MSGHKVKLNKTEKIIIRWLKNEQKIMYASNGFYFAACIRRGEHRHSAAHRRTK